ATGSRGGAVSAAAGWTLTVILLTATRPEGDFLFAAGSGSYLFLLGGIAVAVNCATLGAARQPGGGPARRGRWRTPSPVNGRPAPVWVSPAVVGSRPDVASMVVRAAEPPPNSASPEPGGPPS